MRPRSRGLHDLPVSGSTISRKTFEGPQVMAHNPKNLVGMILLHFLYLSTTYFDSNLIWNSQNYSLSFGAGFKKSKHQNLVYTYIQFIIIYTIN